MSFPEIFKLDVRIRARLLAKGAIREADVAAHLDGLADQDAACLTVDEGQPALLPPSDRRVPVARPAPIARPRPAPEAVEPWDDDEDDVPAKPKAAAKPVARAEAPKAEAA
ncbi:MAG: hypothetical protein FJ104_17355, partial [Deltaproteobacteria bacterium]|nr:hypothetical protein [Deltaproteobacteria bacterium]